MYATRLTRISLPDMLTIQPGPAVRVMWNIFIGVGEIRDVEAAIEAGINRSTALMFLPSRRQDKWLCPVGAIIGTLLKQALRTKGVLTSDMHPWDGRWGGDGGVS